jgi:hypothetical protein
MDKERGSSVNLRYETKMLPYPVLSKCGTIAFGEDNQRSGGATCFVKAKMPHPSLREAHL